MPLKAFALPTLGVVALLLEVLPASECASGSFNKCTNENLQGHRQDELNKQEEEVEDCNPALLSDVTVRKREKIRCDQRQQLLVLARKQHVLERQMRKGLLSWSEVASWKLTHIEVQRLFLRIVQLKVQPPIAALLSSERQVQEFLRLLEAAIVVPLKDQQQVVGITVETQEQQQVGQPYSLSSDDSPAVRCEATCSAVQMGDGENSRCFWEGYCGTLMQRELRDLPLILHEALKPDAAEVDDETASESSTPAA